MRRPVLGTLFALAACLIVIPASTSATPEIGQKANGWAIHEERYLETYEKCWDAFKADCGANLVDDNRADPLPVAKIKASTERMAAWLNPPEPPAVDSSVIVAEAPVTTSVPTTSAGGCPSYMAGEATSPDAVNPTSGAAGCFQIIPSTQAAHGCAAPDAACAAAICATQGDDAWVAADPCAYLGTEP